MGVAASKHNVAILSLILLLVAVPAMSIGAYLFYHMAEASSADTCAFAPGIELDLVPDLPIDQRANANEDRVNCFAWQTFIALNWPVDRYQRGVPDYSKDNPLTYFGNPNDQSATVWQTYRLVADTFPASASVPAEWNTDDTRASIPPSCRSAYDRWQPTLRSSDVFLTVLSSTSKFEDVAPLVGADQVLPAILVDSESKQQPPDLIDQHGHRVRYEARINSDAFHYIRDNSLYNADKQNSWASSAGMILPPLRGAEHYTTIQIKAAWRQIAHEPDYVKQRYKTALALTLDKNTGRCAEEPVMYGLVGLHIVRKSTSMYQFMWSTFEHIDNVPPNVDLEGAVIPYSFHDPRCASPKPCTPNATPLPGSAQPVQVERKYPISAAIDGLNTRVRSKIHHDSPHSVWQYYQLVNVSWPSVSSPRPPGVGAKAPIDISLVGFKSTGSIPATPTAAPGAPTPTLAPFLPVSNVVMETYVQDKDCTFCHTNSRIAGTQGDFCPPQLASDFSFIFRHAVSWSNSAYSCSYDPTNPDGTTP